MTDYSKWDKIQDSDDEDTQRSAEPSESYFNEEQERMRKYQEDVDLWLRRTMSSSAREPVRQSMSTYSKQEVSIEPRKVTKEERRVLAMLIARSHFEEGETNLGRHAKLLELTRQHRWLEEDPGSLEFLCQLYNHAMRKATGDGQGHRRVQEDPEDTRLREMVLSGINTLAAPKKCECSGGLLELVTQICTPVTDKARDNRLKWQKKEFAKDALFDSLFPDMRHVKDNFKDDEEDPGMTEVWVLGGVIVLLFLIVIYLLYSSSKTHSVGRLTTTTTTMLSSVLAGGSSREATGPSGSEL